MVSIYLFKFCLCQISQIMTYFTHSLWSLRWSSYQDKNLLYYHRNSSDNKWEKCFLPLRSPANRSFPFFKIKTGSGTVVQWKIILPQSSSPGTRLTNWRGPSRMLCDPLSIIATATCNGFIQAGVGAVTAPWRKAKTFLSDFLWWLFNNENSALWGSILSLII